MSMNVKNEPDLVSKNKVELPDSIQSLAVLNGGMLFQHLDEVMRSCLLLCKQQQAPGKVKLEIQYIPEARIEGLKIFVSADVVFSPPRMRPPKNLFFISDDGKLTRNDPEQFELLDDI